MTSEEDRELHRWYGRWASVSPLEVAQMLAASVCVAGADILGRSLRRRAG